MRDRIPTYPGRVQLTPVAGQTNKYDMTMADEPTETGTPLNKALFDKVIAAYGTTAGTSTAYTLAGDGGFALTDGATIRFKLHVDSGATPTINVNGTGAKAIMADYYTPMDTGIKAGTWLTATYSSTLGFFVLQGSGAKFVPFRAVYDENSTLTIAKTGVYRITAIGAGADGTYIGDTSYYTAVCDGGCGGGGYIEKRLFIGDSVSIAISSTASVSVNGTPIITATAGGTVRSGSSYYPLAGSVSGTGVVAFASNGTNTKSITAPAIFPSDFVSSGGSSGYACSDPRGEFTQNGSTGGSGLFGGDGGAGGSGFAFSAGSLGYEYCYSSSDGFAGGRGAGNGGKGCGIVSSRSTTTYGRTGGSGGGGGFGGGGGASWVFRWYGPDGQRYDYGGAGSGGKAGVVIERIE